MNTKNSVIFILSCFLSIKLSMECEYQQVLTYAKIPDGKSLMSLSEFDQYVVNFEMSRMYIGLLENRIPHRNYFSTISKPSGTSTQYRQTTLGETADAIPLCNRTSSVLVPASTSLSTPEAIFNLEQTNFVIVFWSSCPTKYVWNMKCAKYFGKKKCLLPDVTLELYVHRTLDDIPMTDIVEDLCRTTGVKFGESNFKWVFTYADNTKCRNI